MAKATPNRSSAILRQPFGNLQSLSWSDYLSKNRTILRVQIGRHGPNPLASPLDGPLLAAHPKHRAHTSEKAGVPREPLGMHAAEWTPAPRLPPRPNAMRALACPNRKTGGSNERNTIFGSLHPAWCFGWLRVNSPLPQNVQGKRLFHPHPFHAILPRNHRLASIMKSELPQSAPRRAASRLQVIRMAIGQTMCWNRSARNQTPMVWKPRDRFSPLPNHVPALANSTESPGAKPLKRSTQPHARSQTDGLADHAPQSCLASL